MRKHTMVPLEVYKTTPGCLRKPQWRLIDPGTLSPWNVMSWGVRQLKGFVIGDGESAPKLQVRELVLVENLQVRTPPSLERLAARGVELMVSSPQEAAELAIKKATSRNASKLDLIYSKESFVEEYATILHDATELSDSDFDVLLLYLSRDCGAIAYDGRVCCTIYLNSSGINANPRNRQSSSNQQMIQRESRNRTRLLHP